MQESLIGVPFFVPQTQPGEVENLMNEDPGQSPGSAEQLCFEDDLAAAQKCRRVNCFSLMRTRQQISSTCGQRWQERDFDALAREFGQQTSR